MSFSASQVEVLNLNTKKAIESGLAARYFDTLRNALEALEHEEKRVGGFPDVALLVLKEIAEDQVKNSSAELPLAYRKFAVGSFFVHYTVALVNVKEALVLRRSDVVLGEALPIDHSKMALYREDPSSLFLPEDASTLVEGYNAQSRVGLNTLLDIDFKI